MRTIKFLGIAVALAAAAVTANAQGGRRFDHFTGLNDLARLEARQIERHQIERRQLRQFAKVRAQRMGQARGMQRGGIQRGAMQRAFQGGRRAGMQLGGRAGFRVGARAGMRAGMRVNATPEQAAFAKQLGEQRQAVRAKVQAGTLTREQARTQMQAWVAEHRPKK